MAAAALKFLLPLAAGGLALFAFGSKASAAPAGSPGAKPPAPGPGTSPVPTPGEPVPSAQVLAQIAAALASADPVQLKATAADLDRQGFKTQATQLRQLAAEIEKAMAQAPLKPPATPGTVPAGVPAAVAAAATSIGIPQAPGAGGGVVQVQLPAIPAPPPLPMTPQVDPARTLAANVNLEIASSTKGRENKGLVSQYQIQENARGKAVGKVDGLYGPKTALTIATDFGIIPSKPVYWPVNPTPAKQAYKKALLDIARQDPQRAEEWARAANV